MSGSAESLRQVRSIRWGLRSLRIGEFGVKQRKSRGAEGVGGGEPGSLRLVLDALKMEERKGAPSAKRCCNLVTCWRRGDF